MRVLVVEDEVLIRMTTVDMVEALGHVVLEAGNAREALEVLARDRVDVVFTDVGLPGMSGTELAKKVHADWPETRIIFASGHKLDPEEMEPALFESIVAIEKPYDESAIETALGAVQHEGASSSVAE